VNVAWKRIPSIITGSFATHSMWRSPHPTFSRFLVG
jgi:hypothetical protein